jgi:drug/metabolite transporter (DMT)-like permease
VAARRLAVFIALFVTFLWSTSWVLIKVGLADIPALTFAGLRYGLAFACMWPLVVLNPARRAALRQLSPERAAELAGLGLLFIAVTQGAQFVSLNYLPAATLTLMLNFTAVIVALLGIVVLAEQPSRRQWLGIGLYLLGALLYFYPPDFSSDQVMGFLAAGICVGANALSSILGRRVNRRAMSDPFTVTLVSLGVGGLALLIAGLAAEGGIPVLTPVNWLIITWLAVVNTALAFTLWNVSLRTLSATESSVINNTMMIQIAILAWVFLGEALGGLALAGMGLAAAGIALVQIRGRARAHCAGKA